MPSPIDLEDFSKIISGFPFGVADKKEMADAFRKVADAVEKGNLLVQGVKIESCTTIDDYALHDLIITYAAKA
jgi:undecaprenyl pyrophosphate synthase